MKSDQLAKSSMIVYVLAGVVPGMYYVALQHLSPQGPPLRPLFVLLFLFLWLIVPAIFGFVLGRRRASPILVAVSAFGGVCLGVIANAIYDFEVNNIDHNLFPFEILLGAILIVPGMLCGWATRQLRYRGKRKE